MAELDRLAEENFGEFGFDTLSNFQKEIVLTLHSIEDINIYPTDLLKNESDNICETKNKQI